MSKRSADAFWGVARPSRKPGFLARLAHFFIGRRDIRDAEASIKDANLRGTTSLHRLKRELGL
jgi:hypothetical protein